MSAKESTAEGQLQLQRGEFEEACLTFSRLLETDAYHIEALQGRSVAYRKLKRFEEALADHDNLVNLLPKLADVYCERGITRYHAGEMAGALADMDMAVELEPKVAYRWASRAYIRGHARDLDGAIEDYRQALRITPEDAILQNNLGILEESKGYKDAAKARFKRADHLAKDQKLNLQGGEPATASPTQTSPANGKQPEESRPQQAESWQAYATIMGQVLTSRQTRAEFWTYLRKQFGFGSR
jgi:Flp pilus assembly protein TadD